MNFETMDLQKFCKENEITIHYKGSGGFPSEHAFRAISNVDKKFVCSVSVYPISNEEYGGFNDPANPIYVNIKMAELLSKFGEEHQIPFLKRSMQVFYTGIEQFIDIKNSDYIFCDETLSLLYELFFINRRNNLHNKVLIVLEDRWFENNLIDKIYKECIDITSERLTVIIFQILYTLASIHITYPSFRHNDLDAADIMINDVVTDNKDYTYFIGNHKFVVPNVGVQIGLTNFHFSCIKDLVENNKVNNEWCARLGISSKENKYYDIHHFFNTFLRPIYSKALSRMAQEETVNFMHRVVPEKYRNGSKYVHKRGRILVNTEYSTPYDVIMKDPLFEKYRFR